MSVEEAAIRDQIEETGKVFEKFDLTPMQGRILSYFLKSDKPEITFDELVKYFQASKSTISNSLNYMLQSRIIDYKTFSTDRKRYFFITESFFVVYFENVLNNVGELKDHVFRTVSMRSPEYPDVSEKILRWIENANAFQETIENTLRTLKDDLI